MCVCVRACVRACVYVCVCVSVCVCLCAVVVVSTLSRQRFHNVGTVSFRLWSRRKVLLTTLALFQTCDSRESMVTFTVGIQAGTESYELL